MKDQTGSTGAVTLADLVALLERLPAWAFPHVVALLELMADFAAAVPDSTPVRDDV